MCCLLFVRVLLRVLHGAFAMVLSEANVCSGAGGAATVCART